MKNALKFLTRGALACLTGVRLSLPRRRERIFLYSDLGFRDNVRALYEALIARGLNARYEIVCAVGEGAEVPPAPEGVRFVSRARGMLALTGARWAFYCFGFYPIRPDRRQQVVNLWHGMPLKRVGAMEEGFSDPFAHRFNRLLATSPFFADIMRRGFPCPENELLVVGQPKGDLLLDAVPRDAALPARTEGRRVVVWLPTVRNCAKIGLNDATESAFAPLLSGRDRAALTALDAALAESGCELWLSPHPLQAFDAAAFSGLSRVRLIAGGGWRASYDAMREADALVTDYSSAYFDYLLLDRPIAFAADDLDAYRAVRGFTVDDPARLMPGAVLRAPDDLAAFVRGVGRGEDGFRQERARVRALVHQYPDGHACERLFQALDIREGDQP